jgi:hypothetical protein
MIRRPPRLRSDCNDLEVKLMLPQEPFAPGEQEP